MFKPLGVLAGFFRDSHRQEVQERMDRVIRELRETEPTRHALLTRHGLERLLQELEAEDREAFMRGLSGSVRQFPRRGSFRSYTDEFEEPEGEV